MPSPVGHSLMGYIVYRAMLGPVESQRWPLIALCLFAANAADLDFFPGLLEGAPDRYHHGISHSIGFAVLLALGFSVFMILVKRETIYRSFAIFFSLCGSHIVLDYLGRDSSFPYGIPLFWPLNDKYYIAPFAFLPDIQRVSSSNIDFITSLFSLHNLWASTVEFLILFPFILLLLSLNRRESSSFNGKGSRT